MPQQVRVAISLHVRVITPPTNLMLPHGPLLPLRSRSTEERRDNAGSPALRAAAAGAHLAVFSWRRERCGWAGLGHTQQPGPGKHTRVRPAYLLRVHLSITSSQPGCSSLHKNTLQHGPCLCFAIQHINTITTGQTL